jgi:hypothetical protein
MDPNRIKTMFGNQARTTMRTNLMNNNAVSGNTNTNVNANQRVNKEGVLLPGASIKTVPGKTFMIFSGSLLNDISLVLGVEEAAKYEGAVIRTEQPYWMEPSQLWVMDMHEGTEGQLRGKDMYTFQNVGSGLYLTTSYSSNDSTITQEEMLNDDIERKMRSRNNTNRNTKYIVKKGASLNPAIAGRTGTERNLFSDVEDFNLPEIITICQHYIIDLDGASKILVEHLDEEELEDIIENLGKIIRPVSTHSYQIEGGITGRNVRTIGEITAHEPVDSGTILSVMSEAFVSGNTCKVSTENATQYRQVVQLWPFSDVVYEHQEGRVMTAKTKKQEKRGMRNSGIQTTSGDLPCVSKMTRCVKKQLGEQKVREMQNLTRQGYAKSRFNIQDIPQDAVYIWVGSDLDGIESVLGLQDDKITKGTIIRTQEPELNPCQLWKYNQETGTLENVAAKGLYLTEFKGEGMSYFILDQLDTMRNGNEENEKLQAFEYAESVNGIDTNLRVYTLGEYIRRFHDKANQLSTLLLTINNEAYSEGVACKASIFNVLQYSQRNTLISLETLEEETEQMRMRNRNQNKRVMPPPGLSTKKGKPAVIRNIEEKRQKLAKLKQAI